MSDAANPQVTVNPENADPAAAPLVADPLKTAQAADWKHASPLISARFDGLGRYCFAGAQDNTVRRFDLATGEHVPLVGHSSWVRAIGGSPDGAVVYTGGYDGQMIWWPAADAEPKPLRTVAAHNGWVRALAVSPDGGTIATCGNDNLVKLWSAADGTLVRELAGHANHVYNVVFHPAGGRLASTDLKGIVKDWDTSTGAEVRQLDASPLHKYDPSFHADIGGARGMAFSADGKWLACGGMTNVSNAFAGVGNPLVVLFDWEAGTSPIAHKSQAAVQGTIWGLQWHPDGYLIGAVGGGVGGILFFWKPDAEVEFHKLQLPAHARDLALHADQLRLAVPHFDSSLRIYRMADGA
jgi:WD40 repeat protein